MPRLISLRGVAQGQAGGRCWVHVEGGRGAFVSVCRIIVRARLSRGRKVQVEEIMVVWEGGSVVEEVAAAAAVERTREATSSTLT